MSATHSRQTSSQAVTAVPGGRAGPRGLGIEVRALLRHAPAGPSGREDRLDAGLAEQERDVGGTRVDGSGRLVQARRVADAVEPVPVDELGVELAVLATDELDSPAPVGNGDRVRAALLVEPAKRFRERRRTTRPRPAARGPADR